MFQTNMQGIDGLGVRNLLWDVLEYSFTGELDLTLLNFDTQTELARELCGDDVDDLYIEIGVEMFLWENKYFRRRPQFTMKQVYHDEASLRTTYLCKTHMGKLVTTTNYFGYRAGQRPICPLCNEDCFDIDWKMSDYISEVGFSIISKDEFDFILRLSKSQEKFWKRYQAKNDWKELIDWIKFNVGKS